MLILAAGYATRLYPLTKTTAKPLIPVAGRPMVEHVLERFATVQGIERVIIVTNAKFAKDFEAWAGEYTKTDDSGRSFVIVNDGSTGEEDKLGAIGDINFVINREKLEGSDLLIVGGDNLFAENQNAFVEFARNQPATIGTYDTESLSEVRKFASIKTGESCAITHFEEKPADPTSTWTGIALYYYREDVLPMIGRYIEEGNNPDQPGRLIEWLYTRVRTCGYPIDGRWFDIGNLTDLERARKSFEKGQEGPA